MLNISFFIAAFSSVSWLLYSNRFIHWEKLIQNATIEPLYQAIFIAILPIIVLWGIFLFIQSYYTEKRTAIFLYNLLDQVKKNSDTTANIGKALLQSKENIEKNITVQKFNLLISDINEILSDIIKRSNSISSSQLEHLWTRTSGGERWILAKTFIEITDYQPGFAKHLQEKALKDSLLKGSILEFYARYKTIQTLLKEPNTDNIFYDMVEYGALGKVFDILTPVTKHLSQKENQLIKEEKTPQKNNSPKNFSLTEENFAIPSFLQEENDNKKEEQTDIIPQKKTEEEINTGLRAIRDELLAPAPTQEPTVSAPIITNFTQTQMALRSIKNEEKKPLRKPEEQRKQPVISLEELEQEINSSPENNYDEYAYPFGAWLNDKKN